MPNAHTCINKMPTQIYYCIFDLKTPWRSKGLNFTKEKSLMMYMRIQISGIIRADLMDLLSLQSKLRNLNNIFMTSIILNSIFAFHLFLLNRLIIYQRERKQCKTVTNDFHCAPLIILDTHSFSFPGKREITIGAIWKRISLTILNSA